MCNAGGSAGHLAPVTESRCVPDSRDEQARSVHDLPARNCFPQPANPNWMPHANLCRSCPGPTFSTNSQAVASGCNACGRSTTFNTPCSFQRGVPRWFSNPTLRNRYYHHFWSHLLWLLTRTPCSVLHLFCSPVSPFQGVLLIFSLYFQVFLPSVWHFWWMPCCWLC